MTFQQLEYFIAVVKHDTFWDAAETLHISQSALSKQILKLERELGITLLERTHRSTSLTKAGEIFYRDALKLTAQYHQVLSNIQSYQANSQKVIHVGTLPILNQYQLTPSFKMFSEQNKDICVTIDEVEEQELLNGLYYDKYDFIIARANMLNSKKYIINLLSNDQLVAVFPANHRFAKCNFVTLPEIYNEPFILMNQYTSIFQLCMDKFKAFGISANLVRTARVESIISAVAIGEGISLLAERNFHVFRHQNVVAVPLEPIILLPVVIARKKTGATAPAVKKLIQFLNQNSTVT